MVELDESAFGRLADETLGRLLERLEDALGAIADVELQEGILSVDLDDGGHFVINKHSANRQLWLASPKSGASHYVWDGGRWVYRGGDVLTDVLADDLFALTGERIALG